jgi:serine protease
MALAVVGATLAAAQPAGAVPPPFIAVGHSPTQGTPVPGAYLTADLGSWTSPPESYEFQWLRDGAPVAGATARDYLVQAADIGHQLAPYVTGHSGADSAHFVGTEMNVRQIASKLTLDVRRVHPEPGRARLVWTAISFMSTERPWATDGGTVTAYRKKDGRWKQLGSSVVAFGAAFVRLPWKRAPHGRTKVRVCFQGSDVVAISCSTPDVVHRRR